MTSAEKRLAATAYGPDDIRVSHGCYEPDEDTAELLFDAPPVITGPGGEYKDDATEGAMVVFFAVLSLIVIAILIGAWVVA